MNKVFPSLSNAEDSQCTNIVFDNEVYEMSPRTLTVSLSSNQPRVTASGTFTLNINDDDGL